MNLWYRRCTGFGHPFQLQSTIKNMPRLKCNIFFTPNFELKILFSIAPIAKNGVQSKVVFFLKKPWGPMSCAELLTWAPNNFILNSTYCSLHRMMFNALTVRWAPFCVLKKCQLFITLKTVKKRVQNGQNMHKIQALKV